MTYLQQRILQPTKHVEERALLGRVVELIAQGRAKDASDACMARLLELERTSAPVLVNYRPELEQAA